MLADAVDEPRGVGAEKRILPVQTVPAHVVVAGVDLGQQFRDFLRRILQVGIERDDRVAADAFKRGHDRHVLAVIGVEIDHAGDVGPRRLLDPQQFERAVDAASFVKMTS